MTYENEPLSRHTRFGIGGPARVYVEADSESAFIETVREAKSSGLPTVVIGGGTNLVVADSGFDGFVLRFTANGIRIDGATLQSDAGAGLQSIVDASIDQGLRGLETMTGIPGSVGGAIYGNAGAYGHSIDERVRSVRFFDGSVVRCVDNAQCEFSYRESIFKRHKNWIVFSTEVALDTAPSDELRSAADAILRTRNEKYPPTMKCAGSIFKNLILSKLPASAREQTPASVIREGKVPSAYFLEQAGAKGLRNGGIHVADYHANLIYNAGRGTAQQVREVIDDLKQRVQAKFGLTLEEEVQYVGFDA